MGRQWADRGQTEGRTSAQTNMAAAASGSKRLEVGGGGGQTFVMSGPRHFKSFVVKVWNFKKCAPSR